jgi:DNA-binding PadR family transcriptional regulator
MFERLFLGGLHRHSGHFMHGGRSRGGTRRDGKRGRGTEEVAGDRGHHGGREHFGRGGFGRGAGGGGRVFGPGDLRLVLLSSIEEKPRHGYELIKDLEAKFGGGYAPSPGSVYPTLTLMEELGHVRAVTSEGSKRLFEITTEGSAYLRENQAALDSALARLDMAARAVSGEAPPQDLHHAMHTLKAALMFHRGGWDTKETERVRKIIEGAAEAIAGKSERE